MKINISFEVSKRNLIIYIISFAMVILLMWQFGFFAWLGAINLENDGLQEQKFISDISRNRGWIIWVVGTFVVAIAGIGLTAWGRIIAHRSNVQDKEKILQEEKKIELSRKSNIHNRYERAAGMLGNEVMPIRIAGCRALRQLAIDDEDMWSPCAGLLFGYIKEPYLSPVEKIKLGQEIGIKITYETMHNLIYSEDDLIKIFNIDGPLRADIQEAINSVSAIYDHVHENDEQLQDEIIQLPTYFWQNKEKRGIYFTSANLAGAKLQKAYLPNVSFYRANLAGAELQNAQLSGSNLGYVKLYDAKLHKAELLGVNLDDAQLMYAELQEVKLLGASLDYANLSNAILRYANLSNTSMEAVGLTQADVTGANMQNAKGLNSNDILSATWEKDEKGKGAPPKLSDDLEKDKDIIEWCKIPDYEWKEGKRIKSTKKKAFYKRLGIKSQVG